MAREAVESPAMSQSTTEIRIVPLAPSQDVLTELLRDGARRLLAQAIEAEVATWIEAGTRELAAPSVKQRLAAIRHLLDCLITGQVVPVTS